ncbi:hypothetical protein J7337_000845 [Fusarium musae]|nr:hypothetical protein J7337_000845 [Fusarium musae]KAG9507295.1 hypothetical protein J7337_000845 [Fusarium musae]RBQ89514.1 hypothetical protein FVER53263_01167 [Fusarium verticillioides]RBR08870.1 hypothetical protein FVER53590_01167 [Fusarium verticillioides]
MGRPRKRRHVDMDDKATLPAPTISQPPEEALLFLQPDDNISYEHQNQTQTTGDLLLNLNFLDDPANANADTWDLQFSHDTFSFNPQIAEPQGLLVDNATLPTLDLSGVDLLGSINFGETDAPQETISMDLSNTLQQYLADQIESSNPGLKQNSDTPTPPDSSETDASVESTESVIRTPTPSMRPVPTVSCGCLSSLYLALESLGNLPAEVIPAMKVARNASRVAHDVIRCTVCSASLLDEPAKPPPIQSFQNLMLLGALVPSACNAYARILEMVDEETALAKLQGRTFWFSFKEIGGLWGCIGGMPRGCTTYQSYNNKNMPPDMWRMTIRGLLRLDVYGLDEKDQEIPGAMTYRQLGLKDVVGQLEERSKKRHDALDALHAAGHTHEAARGVIYPTKACSPAERNCTKVLETARIALENLVIA